MWGFPRFLSIKMGLILFLVFLLQQRTAVDMPEPQKVVSVGFIETDQGRGVKEAKKGKRKRSGERDR